MSWIFALYPHRGTPGYSVGDAKVALSLAVIPNNYLVQQFLTCYFKVEFLLSHLIFLGALICLIWNKMFAPLSKTIKQLSLVIMMLFLTTFCLYFIPSLCQIAKMRYAIAGDLELHLLFLLAFEALLWGILGLGFFKKSRQ